VVSFTPRPLYPQGKVPPLPIEKETTGFRAGLDVGEKREIGSSRLVFKKFDFLSDVTGNARKSVHSLVR